MNGLLKNGLDYKRRVSSVDDILELYKRQTVTTWGTRTSFYLESDKAASSNPRSEKQQQLVLVTHTFKMHYTTCTITKKGEGGSHSMKGCQSLHGHNVPILCKSLPFITIQLFILPVFLTISFAQ